MISVVNALTDAEIEATHKFWSYTYTRMDKYMEYMSGQVAQVLELQKRYKYLNGHKTNIYETPQRHAYQRINTSKRKTHLENTRLIKHIMINDN